MNRIVITILSVAGLSLFTACSQLNYCTQCISGHFDVMSKRRPIVDVLQDPAISETERKQLAKVLEIRSFAVQELGLPDNDSYRLYADVGRPYVVWNVVATPEFSLTPKQWCYPVVGCVAYQGFFDEEKAKSKSRELSAQGFDVDVYGVKAYSTLRWFNDPVLNTFLNGNNSQLAGLIFHELAHQVVYVSDDCAFNEAFAKTVEIEGLRRWLRANSDDREWQDYLDREIRSKEFLGLLKETRSQLVDFYAQPMQEDARRAGKREIFISLAETLRHRRNQWPNPAAIDKWLARDLNNARLASIATYHDQVPAFQAILDSQGGDLRNFFDEVKKLSGLPARERKAKLEEYGINSVKTTCVEDVEGFRR